MGNARTFVVNYLLARQQGWRVLMRVEDLDGPRVKAGAVDEALDDLRWLGLEWDSPAVFQSARVWAYQAALEQLIRDGCAYPCACSRKDVERAASAPHRGDGHTFYSGTCRDRFSSAQHARQLTGRPIAWRVRVDDQAIDVRDEFVGTRRFELSQSCGDFVIFKNDATAGYQLAVVVDDAEAGVNAIVRGDDLLESAARQIHLRRLLGLGPEPTYYHLPLVVGPDGRRLAKRHGDTRLSHYRELGTPPARVLGLLGYWSGLFDKRREAGLDELLKGFDLRRMPKEQVIFSRDDDEFLRGR